MIPPALARRLAGHPGFAAALAQRTGRFAAPSPTALVALLEMWDAPAALVVPAGDLRVFARLLPTARRPVADGSLPAPGPGVALLTREQAERAVRAGAPPREWRNGERLDPELSLEAALPLLGYTRVGSPPGAPGEWRLVGDRLHLWPLGGTGAVALDLFGEALEHAPADPFPLPVADRGPAARIDDWRQVGRWVLWRDGEVEDPVGLPPGLEALRVATRPRPGDALRVTRPRARPGDAEAEEEWANWLSAQGILPVKCGPGRDWEIPLASPEHWEGPGVWLLPPPRGDAAKGRLFSMADLAPGDMVVHRDHGLARYTGLTTTTVEGRPREFLRLEFAGGDEILVPVSSMLRVQRYVGDPSVAVPDRLGGTRWRRRVAKVKEGALAYARDLFELYRKRAAAADGTAWEGDEELEAEFARGFGHEPTADQVAAVRMVLADLGSSRPMDRVLAGDVGYGKTEVALRAAFRVLADGGQAALLAPTTVLVRQHAERAAPRLDPFGIPVFALSRLTPDGARREARRRLAAGEPALVVGTHELVQGGLEMPGLGILVVDEEQRFGVRHKEAIPLEKAGLDLLFLSATPIPRTLFSSVVGLRDASSLEIPPPGRLPVATTVERWDEALVGDTVAEELARGGKVFFLHNRIRTLARRREWLEERFDRVEVVHGRLTPAVLERRLLRFLDTPGSILLTTSLIQNGVDIPGVDTIVVEEAHRFGLGELHQLRGRIGRRGRAGVALFCLPEDGELTPAAATRLDLLAEHAALGAGFRLARADLELRGAGEILGTAQSGHMAAVGLELFGEILADAVASVRGEPGADAPFDWQVPVAGALPAAVPESERLAVYARIFEEGDPEAARVLAAAAGGRAPEGSDDLLLAALLYRTAKALPLQAARWRGGRLEVVPRAEPGFDLPAGWRWEKGRALVEAPLDSRSLLAALDGLAESLPT